MLIRHVKFSSIRIWLITFVFDIMALRIVILIGTSLRLPQQGHLGVLHPIVGPAGYFLFVAITEFGHNCLNRSAARGWWLLSQATCNASALSS